jgi:tetratricopeptide (TPR) repeat protein
VSRQKQRKELKKKTKAKATPHKTGGRTRGKMLPLNFPNRPSRSDQIIMKRLNHVHQLLAKGQAEAALDLVDDILDEYPDNVPALGVGAFVYGEAGLYFESLQLAQEAFKQTPNDPMLLNLVGTAYIQLGYRVHFLRVLRHMNTLNIKDEDIFNQTHRGLIVLLEKDIADFAQEESVDPKTWEQAMFAVEDSQLAMMAHNLSATLEYARQAVELIPGWSMAQNNLVYMLHQAGEGREALEQARLTLDANPDNFNSLNNMALLLGLAGQVDEARALHDRLIPAFEHETSELGEEAELPLYSSLALTLATLEDDAALYKLFKALVEANDDEADLHPEYLRYLFSSSWNLGHPEEARHWWDLLDASERTLIDITIFAELNRPCPPEIAPFRVPYLAMDELLPIHARTRIIIPDLDQEGHFLKLNEMKAGYAELKPYYPIAKALGTTLLLGNPILVQTIAKIMLTIAAPELVQAARDFALGVYGPQVNRKKVVSELIAAEELPEEGHDTIRFWVEENQNWEELPPSYFTEESAD